MTNEQIATEVMGWRYEKKYNNGAICAGRDTWSSADKEITQITLPDFLNDHNAAMIVVEKMREDGFEYKFCSISDDKHLVDFWTFGTNNKVGRSENKSLCYAISEAALKAKGG